MTDLLDIIEARSLRDQGMALVEDAEETWSSAAQRCIAELARSGQRFTSDDVRAVVGSPRHPNAVGAVFKRAVAADVIACVGHVQSQRVAARARWLPVYRGFVVIAGGGA